MRVPFFHSNIDKDEVLFYDKGQFFSRAGIGEAFITHHPQGLQHGPQAAAIEASVVQAIETEQCTKDIGGKLGTSATGDAIAAGLKA